MNTPLIQYFIDYFELATKELPDFFIEGVLAIEIVTMTVLLLA